MLSRRAVARRCALEDTGGLLRNHRRGRIDLVLELGVRHGLWAVEIKRSLAAKPERGFYQSLGDLQPARAFVVYSGTERYPLGKGIEAVSLRALAQNLAAL